jgi:hypothetical protein
MSLPLRLQAHGDILLGSANGAIKHNAKAEFAHAHNSFLKDLVDIKAAGSLNDGDMLKFDVASGKISAVASTAFLGATALDDYSTTSEIAAAYVAKADEFITSVSGPNIAVTAGDLTVDLSSYLTSAFATDNYYGKASGENLATRVGSLESDHVTVSQFNTLTTTVDGKAAAADVTTLEGRVTALEGVGDAYITSVGANLSVTAGELTISGLALASDVQILADAGYQTASDVADAIAAIDYSSYALNSDLNLVDGRVAAVESAGYQTASDVSSAIAAIDYTPYALADDVTAIDNRVSTLEGNLQLTGVNEDHFIVTDGNLEFRNDGPPLLLHVRVKDSFEFHGEYVGPHSTIVNGVSEYKIGSYVSSYHLSAPSRATGILELPLCRVKRYSYIKIRCLISGAVSGMIELEQCATIYPSYSLISGTESKRVLGSSLTGDEASLIVNDDAFSTKQFAVSYDIPAGCYMVAFAEHHFVNTPDPALYT